MIKIRVYMPVKGYTITEVTEDTYKIIKRKVIESIEYERSEKSTFDLLFEDITKINRLMETCITMDIYEQAIQESTNNIKNK